MRLFLLSAVVASGLPFIGCQSANNASKDQAAVVTDTTVTFQDTLMVPDEAPTIDELGFFPFQKGNYSGDLLNAGGYHWDEVKQGLDKQPWLGLFKSTDGAYYVADTRITIKKDFDPVLDDDSTNVTGWLVETEVKDTSVVLVSKVALQKGIVTSLPIPARITDDRMVPGDSIVLHAGGSSYILRASGKQRKDADNWSVTNYQLHISGVKAGSVIQQLLISNPSNDDSLPSIIFMGDLDGDQVPDLLLNTTHHYNAYVPTLYLSKDAAPGQLYKIVALHVSVGC